MYQRKKHEVEDAMHSKDKQERKGNLVRFKLFIFFDRPLSAQLRNIAPQEESLKDI